MPEAISQSTKVTLGIAVSALGGALWLSTIYANVIATKEEVQSIKAQMASMQVDIRSGSERQTKLETQFLYIQQSLEEIKKGLEKIKN